MKTDVVLTMAEYLDQCCAFRKPVSPPAPDARHIPIAAEGNVDLKNEAHGCRCDRWGHPCHDCIDKSDVQTRTACEDFSSANK
jgi:hypothetical protein